MEDYSKKKSKKSEFSSPLSLGLLKANPLAKTPVEAILFQAEMLLIESGMTEPPFSPRVYAPLRGVKEVVYKDMKIDGRLIPFKDGFIIELRKDRAVERINFTFAHELAHTFFYESVPSIKYRTTENNYPQYDEEEEKLCNVAASELLMPTPIFSKIVKDFSASPQSLQKIAQIFRTSLTATIVKLLSLRLWDAGFVLWTYKDEQLEPQWIARLNYSLSFNPKCELVNPKTTSVYQTFLTGEPTCNPEWFSLDGGYKLSRFQSIRLNSKTVLSCFTNSSSYQFSSSKKSELALPTLPVKYDCKCDGTGWYSIKKDGISYAARCKASEHKNPLSQC